MQATVFRGRGVAQKAAQKAARQAEQEWRAAGDNVPQPAAYMSLGERAARQESSSLNLQLPKARETKAQRKCRLEKEAADRLAGVDTEPQRQATAEAALLPLARAQGKTPSHRQPSCLATSLVRSILYAKSGVARSTVGIKSVGSLKQVKERWEEFRVEREESPEEKEYFDAEMERGYPSAKLTGAYFVWLLTTRQRRDHASKRQGKAQAIGRKLNTVEVFMEHAQNHVWRDLFGRMPFNSKVYWKAAKAEVHNLVAAGAGAAREHAENVADDACQAAAVAQSDVTAEDVATAARSALYGALKQSTEPVATREHLHQVGEYQLQDVLLSEVFRVNESIILEAYAGFARLIGCRPGMAMI